MHPHHVKCYLDLSGEAESASSRTHHVAGMAIRAVVQTGSRTEFRGSVTVVATHGAAGTAPATQKSVRRVALVGIDLCGSQTESTADDTGNRHATQRLRSPARALCQSNNES